MNRNFLPRQGVQLVDQSGCTTNPFYVWMQRLDSLLRGGAEIENIAQTLAQLRAALADLQSTGYLPGTANVVGINSVVSLGDLVNGVVTVQLLGDVQTPYSFQFYAADNRCIRGWQWLHPVIEAGDCMVKTMDGFNVLGVARNEDDLPDTPSDGDAYLLESTGHILRWDDGGAEWVDEGEASGVTTLALEQLPDTGVGALLAITRDAFGRVEGTKEATITGTVGEIEVANGDAVAGLPTISLADVTPTAGGILQKYGFDAKGRRNEEEAATTDDLTEGATNLYFTDARAQEAVADILDGTGDVEIHYEDTPDPRIYAELSAGVQASLALADTALQPGDNISALTNDAGYLTDAPIDGNTYGRKDGAWEQITTSGSGTVTSVGLSVPAGFQVSGSPVTTSGTLTVTYDTGYQGYTSAEASKLSGIASGATVGADWNVNLSNIPASIAAWQAMPPSGRVTIADTISFASGGAINYIQSGQSGGGSGTWDELRIGPYMSSAWHLRITSAGVAEFNVRPVFNGNTPWDSANFNPATKANDADVVKLTGAQTVAGIKTLTDRLTVNANLAGVMSFTSGSGINYLQSGADTTTGSWQEMRFSPYGSGSYYLRITSTGEVQTAGANRVWDAGNLADSGWQALTYSNSWSAYTAGSRPTPGVRKFGSFCQLRGHIAPGTTTDGTLVATLPTGYRPTGTLDFLVGATNIDSVCRVRITSSGNITVYDVSGVVDAIALNSISFYVD